MMKKSILIMLSLILLFSFTACDADAGNKKYSKSLFDYFDTASTITAYDSSQNDFNKHVLTVENEIEQYSKLFDIYSDYKGVINLKYVNENAAKSPVKVDKKIIDLLKSGKKAYRITNGKTNICFGSVLKEWHNAREYSLSHKNNAYIPDMKLLKEYSKHTDINNLILDEEESTVFFKDKYMRIDVGAIAKGYVCERLAEFIEENNIWKSAIISLGGNIKTIGYKNEKEKNDFTIGVENPEQNSDFIAKIKASNGECVVTSGGYQRYYTVGNNKYCHIIDTSTLMPANFMTSISVISSDSFLADTLSTALFCTSVEDGLAVIENNEEAEAVWVDFNGKVTCSSGVKLAN